MVSWGDLLGYGVPHFLGEETPLVSDEIEFPVSVFNVLILQHYHSAKYLPWNSYINPVS